MMNTMTVTFALKIKCQSTLQQSAMAIVNIKVILRFAQFVLCYPVSQKVKRNSKSLLAIFGGIIQKFVRRFGIKREVRNFTRNVKNRWSGFFGTAKEYHNLRYTREVGKSKMKAKVGLTLACLNIKKIGKSDGGGSLLIFL